MKMTALSLFLPFRHRTGPGLLTRLLVADSVWRQRRALERMDPDQLDDLGLSAQDVEAETRKTVWDVPQHWLR